MHEMHGRHAIAYFLAGSLAFNIPSVKAQEISPPTQAPAESVPGNESQAEDLVLQIQIDGTEMQEFVQGIRKDGQLYLPLGEISFVLDFPITVEADKKTADGWFINDKYEFSLVGNNVKVRGKKSDFETENIIVKDQDLYIDASLLQKWFPLDFTIDMPSMTLNISTRESLPYMEALLGNYLQCPLYVQKI